MSSKNIELSVFVNHSHTEPLNNLTEQSCQLVPLYLFRVTATYALPFQIFKVDPCGVAGKKSSSMNGTKSQANDVVRMLLGMSALAKSIISRD
jgi:hypothetical protein